MAPGKSDIAPDTVIADKYRLRSRISSGGMGSVWRAHHAQLDAPVAVKLMLDSQLSEPGARARFEREAKAAAQIRSPYVVHVYDHGIDDATGLPFIVMELLEGEDLAARLTRVGRVQPEQALRICTQLCNGLERAHAAGIVHRDMKPGNIFLCVADDDMVKILDFGIAKHSGTAPVPRGESTTAGYVLGSPQYMSPEQVRGQPLDGRSDLWSLAVVMFRVLTGERPFDAADMGDLLVKICTSPVPAASGHVPALGAGVDRFFERAFARDPSARFQDAKAFASAFETALASGGDVARDDEPWDPPSAKVTTAPARIKFQRRGAASRRAPMRRVGAVAVGLVLTGAIILTISSKPGELAFDQLVARVKHVLNPYPEKGEVTAVTSADASATADRAADKARDTYRQLYAQVRLNEIPEAVDTLEVLLKLDPKVVADKQGTILQLAERAIDRRDGTPARMLALLTNDMGALGVDLLFDLMATRATSPAGKEARRLLAGKALRERGSKDMQLAYTITSATRCSQKAHILRAKGEGGERTLRAIRATTECARTVRCCLLGDTAVAAVVSAIEARK